MRVLFVGQAAGFPSRQPGRHRSSRCGIRGSWVACGARVSVPGVRRRVGRLELAHGGREGAGIGLRHVRLPGVLGGAPRSRSACWKATAVLTVSVVFPASPFWEMKASVRMQEAWGCVKRAMRVLRFQVTSWGERADWRGVLGRGVALGRLGACFRACTGGAPGETLIAVSRRRGTRAGL